MNKDRVKGTIDEAVGQAKRTVGKVTGNHTTEIKGAVQQVKGKVENAWGKLKDAAKDVETEVKRKHQLHEVGVKTTTVEKTQTARFQKDPDKYVAL